MRYSYLLFLLLLTNFIFGQTKIKGQVIDFDTTIPIAFAKITYDKTTVFADWEGKFSLEITDFKKPLYIRYKGYYEKPAYASNDGKLFIIKLTQDINKIKNEYYSLNKVNHIVKKVIENKKNTQPEKALDSYEYKNYEYIQITANPDSISGEIDKIYKRNLFGKEILKLDSTNYKFKKLVEKSHIYQTEKVNLIQHNQYSNKETVLATRMAGFKEPLYEFLGLKLISYSVYENPFELLEIPLQNPISNYGRKLYTYHLLDSTEIQNRKVYRIYFEPKKLRANRLRGILHVDAENFSVAKAQYRIYGIVNVDATYTFNYLKKENIWFPEKRKIILSKGSNSEDLTILGGTMKFRSSLEQNLGNNASDRTILILESTPFDIKINEPVVLKFDGIKVYVPESSLKKSEKYWNSIAKDTIDIRKMKTYTSLDSLSQSSNIERKIFLGKKIINGYLPISYVDLDLRSILKYNNYEGFRIGLGAVTNNKVSEDYKVAFYGAYGFKDEGIKYGITPSYLLNKLDETWLSISYIDDVSEIGQTTFATDSRRFRVYDPRPFNISTFYNNRISSAFIESKILPKTSAYFSISQSEITPLFDYTFINNGQSFSNYNLTSAQFSIQWNPFSSYMQTPLGKIEIEKRHPKFSLQITQTIPEIFGNNFDFTKVDFKTFYEIPYLSGQKSSFLFQTGLAFGDIPLTQLYAIAPNNLNKDAILKRITFAGKNSFETMYYNEFFSDKYVSMQLKHTFNRINIGYKLNPEFTVVTRMAFGTIDNPENHVGLPFNSLEKGFFESGVECNKLFKGFGLVAFYRYGNYQLANFDDNIAIKISYNLDLGL
ncbi:DUF5686 family protein [uncultured Flavobacterium sp.]|uniref:DUF5686 family protein n=1 Tax=uncultured Flavobacterium sp. TaxID=165435 RepID=UPI0030EF9393|tara:strand:- start:142784 stop:145267 length:2484 start_codon:yes stop_codon:yes gene_type:complete